MMSKSRARNGVIAFVWLLSGAIVVLRATMQYTTFGGSMQQHSPSTHAAIRGSRTTSKAWNDSFSGSGYRPANNKIESQGAWMGVCVASALACIVQGLASQPTLVFVVLTGLILGLAAKEGKFNAVGGQSQAGFRWPPSTSQTSSGGSWGSSGGLNNAWQQQSGFRR